MNSLHACGQSKDAKSTLYGKGRLSICWKYHGIVNIHYFGKFTKVQGLTFINAGMKTWLKKKKTSLIIFSTPNVDFEYQWEIQITQT